jgi:Rrf2 family protein
MVQLARSAEQGLTIPEMATGEALSTAYVGKLMRVLRQAGLVSSTRGQAGGYRLARPADDITVDQIIHALDGTLWSEDLCQRYTGTESVCVHSSDCAIRALWTAVDTAVEQVLSRCRLSDLLCSECAMERWMKDVASA